MEKIKKEEVKMDRKKVFLAVDLQRDFCAGGSLEVGGAEEIIPIINRILSNFSLNIASIDWHPENHISFKSQEDGGAGWPNHCVVGTMGAEFHLDLKNDLFAAIIRKGISENKDAYSAFEDTGLRGMLKELEVREVYIAGLALDYCVKATAIDSAKAFETYVFLDATRAVDRDALAKSCLEMKKAGVIVIDWVDIFIDTLSE